MSSVTGSTAAGRPGVHVMHLLHKLGIGGMEVGVIKLANLLPRESVVSSICSSLPADGLKRRLAPDVRLYEFNRRPGNDFGFVYQLTRVLRRQRPDVLHTHGWGTLGEGLLAARLAGVPCVVHGEHGTMETRRRNRALQRWAWHRCDRVLAVSSRLAERMAAEVRFPLDRITTIRNGVELARFAAGDRTRGRRMLHLDPQQLAIGIVGRLVPVKDHATFLDALARLRDAGARFQGVIVGDGVLRADLESRAAALRLTGVVRFVGHIENVPDALAAMDLFVLSSRSEGLSNTIAEAMAAGLPIVATRVGGADELVEEGKNGLLVPPDDPAALAGAIAALLQGDPKRRAFGEESRRRAATRFSVERMVAEYERMYLDVAQRRGAAVGNAASAQI